MKWDIFTVAGAVAGVSTINNIAVNNGDTVRALVDNPSATNDAHWAIAENNPDTPTVKSYIDKYDISAASINSTGTVTLTRAASNLTFQVPTAISGLSFDPNTGILTSSYTNNAISTTITVAANEVSDNVFRIKDNTDATKKIAFEASGIATGQTRTITMPNANVDLGKQFISSSYSTSTGAITFGRADGTNTTIDMSSVRRYAELVSGTAPAQPNVNTFFKLNGNTSIDIRDLYGGKYWEFQSSLDGTLTLTKGSNSKPIIDNEGNTIADSGTSSCNITLARFATIKVTDVGTYWLVDYGPGRLLARSQSLGLVSTEGPGAGSTKYKTTFVRSSGSGFTSNVTVTIPDSNVNLGLVGQTDFADNQFRISDNTDATKKIAFEASSIATGQTKTITMPDVDVDLGNVAQAATATLSGYLSSTDWNKFNSSNQITLLLPTSSNQNLVAGKTYALPKSYAGALNLTLPSGTAEGEGVTIMSAYATGLDGTSGVNLTAVKLTIPVGEFVTGYGATNPINLLQPYSSTVGNRFMTPPLVQGTSLRITKVDNSLPNKMWAIAARTGNAVSSEFLLRVPSGGVGGSLVHTKATAGGFRFVALPDKDVDLGDLPSVATNDNNSLSGTAVRCRILGGSGNTVSGMDNIVIGGLSNAATGSRAVLINCIVVGATNNDVTALNARGTNASNLEANSILLGTSRQPDLFKSTGASAALRLNALHTISSAIPISGTLYATIDGSQTLSASNLVLGVNDTGACATHEVEFMVCAGVASTFGGVMPAGYFIAKRRIVVFRHAPSGTFFVSAVQTIGTDITLGTLDGTITPDLSIDTTTGSATIHRLLCKIDRTGGVAGQEVVAMSVRVTSHHSK